MPTNYRMYAANQEIIETAVQHREVLLTCLKQIRGLKDQQTILAVIDEALEIIDTPYYQDIFSR